MQHINVAALQRSVFPKIPSEQRPHASSGVPCPAHCLPVSLGRNAPLALALSSSIGRLAQPERTEHSRSGIDTVRLILPQCL